jgi:hypothetical protein
MVATKIIENPNWRMWATILTLVGVLMVPSITLFSLMDSHVDAEIYSALAPIILNIKHNKEDIIKVNRASEKRKLSALAEITKIGVTLEKYRAAAYSEMEENKLFHMRRLNAAVEEGAEDHAAQKKEWEALDGSIAAKAYVDINELKLKQDILWIANNRGGRFTTDDGKDLQKEDKHLLDMILQYSSDNTMSHNVINDRLTTLFRQVEFLDDRVSDKPEKFRVTPFLINPPENAPFLPVK